MCWTTEESLTICTEKHKPNQLKTTTTPKEVLTNDRSLYTSTAQQHASGSKPKQPIFHLFYTCNHNQKNQESKMPFYIGGDGQDHPMTLGNEKNWDIFLFFFNQIKTRTIFSLCPSKKAHCVLTRRRRT